MREFLRNAFALDDGTPCEPTDEQRAVLTRLVDEVTRRRMTGPALAFLEMSRPLGALGAVAFCALGAGGGCGAQREPGSQREAAGASG